MKYWSNGLNSLSNGLNFLSLFLFIINLISATAQAASHCALLIISLAKQYGLAKTHITPNKAYRRRILTLFSAQSPYHAQPPKKNNVHAVRNLLLNFSYCMREDWEELIRAERDKETEALIEFIKKYITPES